MEDREQLEKQASELGREHGLAAGSWVVDGNSKTETLRGVLRAIEDGELEIPAPLSGEWADDPTPARVFEALEVEDDGAGRYDYLLDIYEASFAEAYEEQAERDARGFLPDEDDSERGSAMVGFLAVSAFFVVVASGFADLVARLVTLR